METNDPTGLRDRLRISTENFLNIRLMPTLLSQLQRERHQTRGGRSLWIELREASNLYAGIDSLWRDELDLLIYTFRKTTGFRKAIPRFEGLITDVFPQKPTSKINNGIWVHNKSEYAKSVGQETLSFADLKLLPVGFVDLSDAPSLFRGKDVQGARVRVESNEALMNLVASKQFVGLAHDWIPMHSELKRRNIRIVPFITSSGPIQVAAFYRRSMRPTYLCKRFLCLLEETLQRKSFSP